MCRYTRGGNNEWKGKTEKQSHQIAGVGLARNLETGERVLDSCLETRKENMLWMADGPALSESGEAKNLRVSRGIQSGRYP